MSMHDGGILLDDRPIEELRAELRVEVVDDDEGFQADMRDLLTQKNFDTRDDPITVTGEDLEEVEPIVERCLAADAILLDLVLGTQYDGFDLGRRVQAHHPLKWIVAVTGHEENVRRLQEEVPFRSRAIVRKGRLNVERLTDQLDELARYKANRVKTVRFCADKLREASTTSSVVGKQLALSAVKEVFAERLVDRLMLPARRGFVDQERAYPVRHSIVLMVWTALERLSLVPGSTVWVPSDRQLSELTACVEVLMRSPMKSEDESEVYDRLRFAGLGVSAQPTQDAEWYGFTDVEDLDSE